MADLMKIIYIINFIHNLVKYDFFAVKYFRLKEIHTLIIIKNIISDCY